MFAFGFEELMTPLINSLSDLPQSGEYSRRRVQPKLLTCMRADEVNEQAHRERFRYYKFILTPLDNQSRLPLVLEL